MRYACAHAIITHKTTHAVSTRIYVTPRIRIINIAYISTRKPTNIECCLFYTVLGKTS